MRVVLLMISLLGCDLAHSAERQACREAVGDPVACRALTRECYSEGGPYCAARPGESCNTDFCIPRDGRCQEEIATIAGDRACRGCELKQDAPHRCTPRNLCNGVLCP